MPAVFIAGADKIVTFVPEDIERIVTQIERWGYDRVLPVNGYAWRYVGQHTEHLSPFGGLVLTGPICAENPMEGQDWH